MNLVRARSGRLWFIAAVVLLIAVTLCAIFMPAMAMAALGACVAVAGLMMLAGKTRPSPTVPRPREVERSCSLRPVMSTGPPVPVPLRT